jgi:hypothetical protein
MALGSALVLAPVWVSALERAWAPATAMALATVLVEATAPALELVWEMVSELVWVWVWGLLAYYSRTKHSVHKGRPSVYSTLKNTRKTGDLFHSPPTRKQPCNSRSLHTRQSNRFAP